MPEKLLTYAVGRGLEVCDRLFADKPHDPEVIAHNELRASILDSAIEDAKDLNRKLEGNDQKKLDQYLSGVRELEKRITRAEAVSPAGCRWIN